MSFQSFGAGCELALLIKLSIIGKVSFRNDAEDTAAAHDDRAIEQPAFRPQRSANDQYQGQFAASIEHPGETCFNRVQ